MVRPRMKMEKVICVSIALMDRSERIVGRAGAIMLVVIRVTSWPRETIRAMETLRLVGHS
jgi:hypothetical protein